MVGLGEVVWKQRNRKSISIYLNLFPKWLKNYSTNPFYMHTWEEYLRNFIQSHSDVVLDQMFKCYSMYIFFPSSKAEVK